MSELKQHEYPVIYPRSTRLTRDDAIRVAAGIVAAAFLFVLPVPHTVTIRLVMLVILIVFCGLLLWRAGAPALPLKLPFAAWATVALLSLLYSVDPEYSFGEIKNEIVYAFATYAVFYYLSWHLRWWTPWLWAVAASLFALSFTNVALWFTTGNTVGARYFYNGVGAYTTYLVTVFPFIVLLFFRIPARGITRVMLRTVPFVFLIPAYFSGNRWVWVVLAVTGLVLFPLFAFKARNKAQRVGAAAALSLLIGLSTVLFFYSLERRLAAQAQASVVDGTIAADPRPRLWRFVAEEIAEQPWTGAGFGRGSFDRVFPQWKKENSVLFHAHNMFLDAGIQMGVPGMLVMLLLFGAVIREYWRLYKNDQQLIHWIGACGIAMVVGVVLKNMTDEFFRRDLALLFWALVGMSLGYTRSLARQSMPDAAGSAIAPRVPEDAAVRGRFLIIRRDNIGDLVCTTPLFAALRARFPRATINALVNSYNAPVVRANPHLDHVYVYTKVKHREPTQTALGIYRERIALMWRLRRARFDYIILPGNGFVPRALKFARLLRPRHIVGFVDMRSAPGIDIALPYDGAPSLHEAEDIFRLLAPFGIDGLPPPLQVVAAPVEVERARAVLQAACVRDAPLALHISARKPSNRWPADNFVALARALHARHGSSFMLFWSPGDENNPRHPGDDAKSQEILQALHGVPVLAYPTRTLDALIGGLACCRGFIGGDGGAMHLAAGLGLPVLAFFGRSSVTRWRPWTVPQEILQPASLDVADVSVAEALAAFERLRGRSGPVPEGVSARAVLRT